MQLPKLTVMCVTVLVAGEVAAAAGSLTLVLYEDENVRLYVPKGWKANIDFAQGTAVMQEDPNRADGAMLMVKATAHPTGVTEQALMDEVLKDLPPRARVVFRSARPGGRGRQVVVDMERGRMRLWFGAYAQVTPELALVVTLTATPKGFDDLAGMRLPFIIASTVVLKDQEGGEVLAPAGPAATGVVPAGEYLPLPVVKSKTEGVAPAELAGKWAEGSGSTVETLDGFENSGSEIGNWFTQETSGHGTVYTFKKNGEYSLARFFTVSGTPGGTQRALERGRYSFDGRVLTLSPARCESSSTLGGKTTPEVHRNLPQRSLRAYSAVFEETKAFSSDPKKTNGGIVLEGSPPSHLIGSDVEMRLQRLP